MPTITERKADQHEALVLRLEALARQVGAVAARQPDLAVAADVRRLAEDLLFRCRGFAPGVGRLPAAAPAYGALGAQLGQALAALEAFELRHTHWSPTHKCVLWQLRRQDAFLPVRRHHPRPVVLPPREDDPEIARYRRAIIRRIDSRYDEGYDDALAGRPRAHRARPANAGPGS